MKRLIQITLAVFLVLGLFSTTFAQNSDNASTDANATVEAPISVTPGNTIEYGTLTTGTDDGSNSPTQAGNFTVDGTASANVDLSFAKSNLTTTSGSGGDQEIVLNLATSGTEDGTWEDGSASADFATASGTNDFFLGNGTTATLPSGGTITVWANPTVTLDGSEVPGSYSGSVTLTATYN